MNDEKYKQHLEDARGQLIYASAPAEPYTSSVRALKSAIASLQAGLDGLELKQADCLARGASLARLAERVDAIHMEDAYPDANQAKAAAVKSLLEKASRLGWETPCRS